MSELAPHERLMRQMMEVCPLRLGQCVSVSPNFKYAGDWPGKYVVMSLTWEYWKGDGHGINVGIASDDDIVNRHGWTDEFRIDDLIPVPR